MKPIGPAETVSRFGVGFQIVFGRSGAMDALKARRSEFLESFWGIALLFPLVLVIYMQMGMGPEFDRIGDTPRIAGHTIYYVIAWLYWPLIMAYVSDMLDKGENWMRFVVALNWSGAAILAMQIVLVMIAAPGSGGGSAISGIFFAIKLWALIVHARLLRHFFATGTAATIGLVAVEFLIGQMLDQARWIAIQSAG
jgi:hypothetical protein